VRLGRREAGRAWPRTRKAWCKHSLARTAQVSPTIGDHDGGGGGQDSLMELDPAAAAAAAEEAEKEVRKDSP